MFRPKPSHSNPTIEDESSLAAAPPAESERQRKKRRRWKKLRRGGLIFLLIGAVFYASLNIYASVLLNRELAAVRAKGEPMTMAEMAPSPIPKSQNAAPLYKQAYSALRLSKDEEHKINESLLPNAATSLKTDALAALQRNAPALAIARQAAAKPQCRFPIDWNKSPTQILFPHYAELRRLARLLSAQAQYKAHSGDVAGALSDVRAVFGISHHLRDEPVLIGFLVARAVEAVANRALSRVLETAPIAAARGQQFRDSLPVTDWSAAYRRAMMGERAFGLWSFNAFGNRSVQPQNFSGDEESNPWRWLAGPLVALWTPFLKLDEVYTLRLWKRNIDELSPMQIPAPASSAEQSNKALQDAPRYAVLTHILFPVFSRARDNRDSIEVSSRQREVALALSAYRAAKGRYPTQISAVQAVWDKPLPLDPYGNRPFVYRSDGRNFILYSIGINRRDEGGHSEYDHNNGPPPHSSGDDLRWNALRPQ